jgi:hypothetical protein
MIPDMPTIESKMIDIAAEIIDETDRLICCSSPRRSARHIEPLAHVPPQLAHALCRRPLDHKLVELGSVFGQAQLFEKTLEIRLFSFEPLKGLLVIFLEGGVCLACWPICGLKISRWPEMRAEKRRSRCAECTWLPMTPHHEEH